MPQKVAIYIRVSTQEQAKEGYSIEAQTERLTAYCKAKSWAIHDVYTDAGFSGSNTQRPALQQLFADIDAGHVDCVLVYKLDRLSRSQKDTLYMIEDVFLSHNVDFVSMQENFDTSSSFGRAMIGILSVFAQLEREQIRERVTMGRAERAKAGLWHGGGYRPYGYNYVNGHLVVNDLEAVMVREVFDLFLAKTPMTAIVSIINERYGRSLGHSAIRSMLEMKLYLGLISWEGNTYEGEHQPIIDEVTFKRAQVLLADRQRIAASKPFPFKPRNLLTGLMRCATCGASYFSKGAFSGRGANKKYRPYYFCYSRAGTTPRKVIDPNCKNPAYAVVDLDARIIGEIEHIAHDRAYFQKLRTQERQRPARSDTDRTALMQRIDELDRQISRVVDLYQLGTISIHEIGQRTQKLQAERDALQTTLNNMEVQKEETRLSEEKALSLLSSFDTVIETGSMDEKRELLQELIKEIVVLPVKGELDIVWNF